MAALTDDRPTAQALGLSPTGRLGLPVKAAVLIYAGALACIDSTTGYAVPGSTATTLLPQGCAISRADNSAGANAAINVDIARGVFKLDNSPAGGDFISEANVGASWYIADDHTAALTNGSATRSLGGKIMFIDPDGGIWCQVGA